MTSFTLSMPAMVLFIYFASRQIEGTSKGPSFFPGARVVKLFGLA
jgi:hypothetical protein